MNRCIYPHWVVIVYGMTLLRWMGIEAQPGSSSDYSDCTGYIPYMKDGYCDERNNIAECGYDGGDCCPCTCVEGDGLSQSCGGGDGYNCVDPGVPDDCGTTPSPAAFLGYPDCTGFMFSLKDGLCSEDLNNEECGYDGGDCCRCTCLENASYSSDALTYECGDDGYDCQDPTAPTDCATESPTPSPAASLGYPECTGYMYNLANSYCNEDLNSAECGFDGGDCCRCTCSELSPYYDCGDAGYDCQDPFAPNDCATESPTPSPAASFGYPDCTGYMYRLQNGYCNDDLNNAECGYDGGDCCRCTCVDSEEGYDCGVTDFDCQDPTVPASCRTGSLTPSPTPILEIANCADFLDNVNNGYCNVDLNNADCGFDGGDCCQCTCVDSEFPCGTMGFSCLDPACVSSGTSATEALSTISLSAIFAWVASISVVACCFGALCIHHCVSWKRVMSEENMGRRSREVGPEAPPRRNCPWRAIAPPSLPQAIPTQPHSARAIPPQPASAPLANVQQSRVMRSASYLPTAPAVSNGERVSGRRGWNDGGVATSIASDNVSRHIPVIQENRRVQTIAGGMYREESNRSETMPEEKIEQVAGVFHMKNYGEVRRVESSADSHYQRDTDSSPDVYDQSRRKRDGKTGEEKGERETAVGVEGTAIAVAAAEDAAGEASDTAIAIGDKKHTNILSKDSSETNGRVDVDDEETASVVTNASRA